VRLTLRRAIATALGEPELNPHCSHSACASMSPGLAPVQEVLDQCDAGARASGDHELFFEQIGVGHDAADTVENLKRELGQDHDTIGLFAPVATAPDTELRINSQ
jgi:hypothetical protein